MRLFRILLSFIFLLSLAYPSHKRHKSRKHKKHKVHYVVNRHKARVHLGVNWHWGHWNHWWHDWDECVRGIHPYAPFTWELHRHTEAEGISHPQGRR